jgi:hypothetical protein
MFSWKREVIVGICIILVSVLLIIDTNITGDRTGMLFAARSSTYVKLWIYILLFLTVIYITKAIKKREKDKIKQNAIFSPTVVTSAILFFLYIYTMPKVGFLVSTLLFTFMLTSYYDLFPITTFFKTKKAITIITTEIKLLFFSLVTTFLIQYAFVNILRVRLPE